MNITSNSSNAFNGGISLQEQKAIAKKLANLDPNFIKENTAKIKNILGVSDKVYADIIKENPRVQIMQPEHIEQICDYAERYGLKKGDFISEPKVLTMRPEAMIEQFNDALYAAGISESEYLKTIKAKSAASGYTNEKDRAFVSNWMKDRDGYHTEISSRNGVPYDLQIKPNK